MTADNQREMSPTMSQVGRVDSDLMTYCESIAAATGGDGAARWSALEACRDYLRLVVRRGKWSSGAGLPATSDLVQETIVDAWHHFSRFQGQSPAQLRAWLKAILTHASLNDRRRQRAARLENGGAKEVFDTGTSPSQAAQEECLSPGTRRGAWPALGTPSHGRSPASLGSMVVRGDRRSSGHLGRCRADALWTSHHEAARIDEAWP